MNKIFNIIIWGGLLLGSIVYAYIMDIVLGICITIMCLLYYLDERNRSKKRKEWEEFINRLREENKDL